MEMCLRAFAGKVILQGDTSAKRQPQWPRVPGPGAKSARNRVTRFCCSCGYTASIVGRQRVMPQRITPSHDAVRCLALQGWVQTPGFEHGWGIGNERMSLFAVSWQE